MKMAFGFLVAATALATVSTAEAHVRRAPVIQDVTCAQAQAYIARYDYIHYRMPGSGAIVPLYGFNPVCGSGSQALPDYRPTLDTRYCHVGFYCAPNGSNN